MHRSKSNHRDAAVLHETFIVFCASLIAFLALAASKTAWAETLVWNARPATNFMAGGTDVATINGVSFTTSGSRTGTFDGAGLNQHEIQPTATINGYTGFVFSIFNGTTDNESNSQTTTLTFGEPVYNVSFLVGDIDGGTTYNDGTNSFSDVIEFRANSGSVLPNSGAPVDSTRVSWNSASGRATAISNANLSDASASITITFAGPVNSLTIRHIGADTNLANPTQQAIFIEDVTFTRSPRLALRKTSIGGFGTFNFSVTNGPTGSFAANVATAVAGTAVTGTQNRLGSINVATTVSETGPSGWLLSSPATCTDANAANSGNPANFTVTISSTAFTIPGTNIRAGAELTCSMTNTKLPTLQLRKTTIGGTGSFSFSATNGYGIATITTTAVGSPASIAPRTLANFSTSTTVTETIPADYKITNISCTGLGSGTATPDFAAGILLLDATATAPGNTIICTYTNDKLVPVLTIAKIANQTGPVSVGDTITYTYRITNAGNTTVNSINISETFNGTGSTPIPQNESLLADNAPNGDSTDNISNNGIWTQLAPGDVVAFTASYTVVQSDIDQLQ
jgi:hypothetical protein